MTQGSSTTTISSGSRNSTLAGSSNFITSSTAYSSSVNTNAHNQDADARSDASFDPLFDDEPDADAEPENGRGVSGAGTSHFALPSNNLAVPSNAADRSSMPHSNGRGMLGIVPPPKNAPPLLNFSAYAVYSPDLLLTASIDGQVVLWDRRVSSPGSGVGRLEMNEKTPPWCLSVSDIVAPRESDGVELIFWIIFSGMLVCGRITGLRRPEKRDS